MNDKKKIIKDSYGRLIDNKSFDEYWDEFHKIENLSMKESIRQKMRESLKLKINNKSYLIACTVRHAIFASIGTNAPYCLA